MERLGLGASVLTACRQQREGGSFTGPRGLGRACGPTGLVCSCYCVRTATVADSGGGALPRADSADPRVPALILRRAVLTSRCRGETAWGPHDRAGGGWWLVWWLDPERPRCRLGSGKPLSTWPTPARWRLGVPPDLPGGRRGLPFLSPHRVPGETLGSSVVIVAILLGGVDRCRRFGFLEPSGRSRRVQRSRGFFVFVDPPLSAFVFFCSFSIVFFGRDYAASAPAPIVGCIDIVAL